MERFQPAAAAASGPRRGRCFGLFDFRLRRGLFVFDRRIDVEQAFLRRLVLGNRLTRFAQATTRRLALEQEHEGEHHAQANSQSAIERKLPASHDHAPIKGGTFMVFNVRRWAHIRASPRRPESHASRRRTGAATFVVIVGWMLVPAIGGERPANTNPMEHEQGSAASDSTKPVYQQWRGGQIIFAIAAKFAVSILNSLDRAFC